MHTNTHPETAAEQRAKRAEHVLVPDANTLRHSDGAPATVDPDNGRQKLHRQKIPGDVVYAATANLTERERSAIRRFHSHAVAHELTNGEAGALIKYSDSAVSTLFRGKYTAGLQDIVTAIEKFFELEDARAPIRKIQFVRTKLTEKIWKFCDAARRFQRIGYIFGDTQIGKTENLEQYQVAHNHGNTIYWSMPTGGNLLNALAELAEILGIPPNTRNSDLRRRIMSSFDDRMLLIVDEAKAKHAKVIKRHGAAAARDLLSEPSSLNHQPTTETDVSDELLNALAGH